MWRFAKLIGFACFVIYEVILANLRVAYAVLMPGVRYTPGFLDYPLSCKKDIQITLLANIISLTPGTMTLEVSSDNQTLLIHTMFYTTKKDIVKTIKTKYERRILALIH